MSNRQRITVTVDEMRETRRTFTFEVDADEYAEALANARSRVKLDEQAHKSVVSDFECELFTSGSSDGQIFQKAWEEAETDDIDYGRTIVGFKVEAWQTIVDSKVQT